MERGASAFPRFGRHHFEVAARQRDEQDPTPAEATFTLVQYLEHPNIAVVEMAPGTGWSWGPNGWSIVDWPRPLAAFYEQFPDDYFAIAAWADAEVAERAPFASALCDTVEGIGLAGTGYTSSSLGIGTRGTLEGASFMLSPSSWLRDDVDRGRTEALRVLAQEFRHRWLAYVALDWTEQEVLLDPDAAHWRWTTSLDWPSPMTRPFPVRPIVDHGDGTFTSEAASDDEVRYSSLDLYLMGLIGADEVGSFFFVYDTSPAAPPSWDSFTFSGVRADFDVSDVIAHNGQRSPGYPASPQVFRHAFVLFVAPGTEPSVDALTWLDELRIEWEEYFSRATGNRGEVETFLFDETRGM